jgi:transcriptional regulator with XRE-family HTH domain
VLDHADIQEFQDKQYRESYADDFLNTYVASQIRVIREQRGMSQQDLADAIGTQQAGISRIENVNYSGWNVKTLKKIAHAVDCRLHISFETYGSLLEENVGFKRGLLQRPGFKEDPKFKVRKHSSCLLYLPTQVQKADPNPITKSAVEQSVYCQVGNPVQLCLFAAQVILFRPNVVPGQPTALSTGNSGSISTVRGLLEKYAQ